MDDMNRKFYEKALASEFSGCDLMMAPTKGLLGKVQWTPEWNTLAALLMAASKRLDEKLWRYALMGGIRMDDGSMFYRQKSLHGRSIDGTWVDRGEDVGVGFLESKGVPGESVFDNFFKLACESLGWCKSSEIGYGNAWIGDLLIHKLAEKGWVACAKELRGSFPGEDEARRWRHGQDNSLSMSLKHGKGAFACWVVKEMGADVLETHASAALALACEGVQEQERAGGVASSAGWEDALLGLRLAASHSGVARIASLQSGAGSDGLTNPGKLCIRLMIEAAKANAAALSSRNDSEFIKSVELVVGEDSPASGLMGFASGMFGGKGAAEKKLKKSERVAAWVGKMKACAGSSGQLVEKMLMEDMSGAKALLADMDAGGKVKAAAMLLSLAKLGFWNMPKVDGAGEALSNRDSIMWAGFKLALDSGVEHAGGAIPGMGGLNLAALCSVLGFDDALAELVSRGVPLDTDPLFEAPSALWLALRNGQEKLALALLSSGADPLEGAKATNLGFPSKDYAIHLAAELAQNGSPAVLEAMLGKKPECVLLPGRGEASLSEKFVAEPDSARQGEWVKLVEKAIEASCSSGGVAVSRRPAMR